MPWDKSNTKASSNRRNSTDIKLRPQ